MIKYQDQNNFNFKLCGRYYVMQHGELTIDNCIYEDDPNGDGSNETYELVRAYALVALGQKSHHDLMEQN